MRQALVFTSLGALAWFAACSEAEDVDDPVVIDEGIAGSSAGTSAGGSEPGGGSGGEDSAPTDGGSGGDEAASGGSAGDEAAGGSGGAPAVTPVYGEHGYFPSTVDADDAEQAYAAWKTAHVEACGANGVRVLADDPTETWAEGVAFGALLAVGAGDRTTFDGLLTFYEKAAAISDEKKGTTSGLMGWRVWSDPCELSEVDPGAPGHSALDMTMALVQASCVWNEPSYLTSAGAMMAAIKEHLTADADGRTILMSADDEDPACIRPGYSAPGYYRVFAGIDTANAAFWNGMADDWYDLLPDVAHPTTGLVSEWAAAGAAVCGSTNDYVGYDAVSAAWRVATDYAWFGGSDAEGWLSQQIGWLDAEVGAEQLADVQSGFFVDGSEILGAPGGADAGYVGAFAAGAVGVSQALSDDYHAVLMDLPKANDGGVRAATSRALYLLFAANRFSRGCE